MSISWRLVVLFASSFMSFVQTFERRKVWTSCWSLVPVFWRRLSCCAFQVRPVMSSSSPFCHREVKSRRSASAFKFLSLSSKGRTKGIERHETSIESVFPCLSCLFLMLSTVYIFDDDNTERRFALSLSLSLSCLCLLFYLLYYCCDRRWGYSKMTVVRCLLGCYFTDRIRIKVKVNAFKGKHWGH